MYWSFIMTENCCANERARQSMDEWFAWVRAKRCFASARREVTDNLMAHLVAFENSSGGGSTWLRSYTSRNEAMPKKEDGRDGWSRNGPGGGMNFRNTRSESDRHSLLTGMRRVVQWLKLELRLEALARPVGISDELDVDVWSRAEYLHFRSLVAEHGYCGRPWIRSVVHPD